MNIVKKHAHGLLLRFDILREFFGFLWKRRLWWSIPVIVLLLILTLLLIFGQATGIAPFIYPLF